MYTHLYTQKSIYIQKCIPMYAYTDVYTFLARLLLDVHTHVYAYVCIQKNQYKHTHVYVYMPTHTCVFMCTHMCMILLLMSTNMGAIFHLTKEQDHTHMCRPCQLDTYVHMRMYINVYTHISTCVCVYTYTCV